MLHVPLPQSHHQKVIGVLHHIHCCHSMNDYLIHQKTKNIFKNIHTMNINKNDSKKLHNNHHYSSANSEDQSFVGI